MSYLSCDIIRQNVMLSYYWLGINWLVGQALKFETLKQCWCNICGWNLAVDRRTSSNTSLLGQQRRIKKVSKFNNNYAIMYRYFCFKFYLFCLFSCWSYYSRNLIKCLVIFPLLHLMMEIPFQFWGMEHGK